MTKKFVWQRLASPEVLVQPKLLVLASNAEYSECALATEKGARLKKSAVRSRQKSAKGKIWIDHSHLPTKLAQKIREQPLVQIEKARRTQQDPLHSRVLALADVALGNKRGGNRRKVG